MAERDARFGGRRGARGAASVEYLVATGVVVTALLVVPVDDAGRGALEMLLDALHGFLRHSTYLLSLP